MLDAYFRKAAYDGWSDAGWSECVRYEAGKHWRVSYSSVHVSSASSSAIVATVYSETSGFHLYLLKNHGQWRIASAAFQQLLLPSLGTRRWRPPIRG